MMMNLVVELRRCSCCDWVLADFLLSPLDGLRSLQWPWSASLRPGSRGLVGNGIVGNSKLFRHLLRFLVGVAAVIKAVEGLVVLLRLRGRHDSQLFC